MKTGIELIAEERQRQIEVECWSEDHDDEHGDGALAMAAACYATTPKFRLKNVDVKISPRRIGSTRIFEFLWPFDWQWWKPTPEDRIRELTKAGALIAAEIDRLQRKRTNHA